MSMKHFFLKQNCLRIRRYSTVFIFCIVFILASSFFLAFASFSNKITYKSCEKLGLPILKIETEYGKQIRSKTDYLDATFEFEDVSGKCKIRGHGNTTWRTRELYKKPYLLKTDEPQAFLGLPSSRKWILLANTADKTSLRNWYSLNLAKKIFNRFSWTPSLNFVTLFINGKYAGLYGLTEKIEIQDGRISIDEANGSFLAEINQHMDRAWNFVTENNVPISIRKPEGLAESQYELYRSRIQALEESFKSIADENSEHKKNYERLQRIADINSIIDWFLVNEFTKNHDARDISSNFFYSDSSDGKFYFSPVWDFDIAMGNINWDDCEKAEGWWIRNSVWYSMLFRNSEFSEAVKERWNSKKQELEHSLSELNAYSKEIFPAVELNDKVWKNIGRRQWPHAPGWKKRKTYSSEVDYMIGWCQKRLKWMDSEINR